MRITFLGTGTSQGVPVIACPCAVCNSADDRDKRLRVSIHIAYKGKSLVIDSGPDFRQQMLRADIQALDALIYTHEHKDHIAGMDDIRAYNYRSKRPMPIYANESVQGALKRDFYYAFEQNPYPGVPKVEMHTIDTSVFYIDDIEIHPVEVMHYKLPVLGFRIADVAYVTDAKTITNKEKEKLIGLDVLILSALRKEEHVSHLSLSDALEWIEDLKPRRAYLTHISHLMGAHDEVEKLLPAHVRLAYDGLVLST